MTNFIYSSVSFATEYAKIYFSFFFFFELMMFFQSSLDNNSVGSKTVSTSFISLDFKYLFKLSSRTEIELIFFITSTELSFKLFISPQLAA